MPYEAVPIGRWGGRNEDHNPNALTRGELVDELNVYLRGSAMGTRPGLVRDLQYASQLSGGVQGIFEYLTDNDATRNLVVINGDGAGNGEFNVIDSGVVTDRIGACTITEGDANLWTFASFKGKVYAAGGADGDSLIVWDGDSTASATVHPLTNFGGTSIDTKFIFEKWGRLYSCGFNGTGADDNPMIVRHTNLFDDVFDPSLTIGGDGVGGFGSYGAEFLTGFGSFTDNEGDWLIVLGNKRLWAVARTGIGQAPHAIVDSIPNGCVHQNAFVDLGLDAGDAIYASDNGIHSLRESQTGERHKTISWKIRETWKTINRSRVSQIVGSYWPNEGIVLFAVPTGSSATNDLVLCLDVKDVTPETPLTAMTAKWTTWKLSDVNASSILTAHGSTGAQQVFVGTTQGDVVTLSTDTYSDLGTAYSVYFTSKHDDYDLPGIDKQVGDTLVRIQPGGTYSPSHQMVYDFDERRGSSQTMPMLVESDVWDVGEWDVAEWASENFTFRKELYTQGAGETISHRFSHSGVNEPFWIPSLATELETSGDSDSTE